MNQSILKSSAIVFLLAGFFLLIFNRETKSQTIIRWQNPNNGWYHHGLNWTGNNVPQGGQTAQFDLDSTYQVWWGSGTPLGIGRMHVTRGDVTLNNLLTTSQKNFTITSPSGFESFRVSGSPDTHATVYGLNLNSLNGASIRNGATLTVDGNHGAGTTFTAGGSGLRIEGIFEVHDGASINTSRVYLGYLTGTTGTVSIGNSTWNNSSTYFVGHNGDGTIDLYDQSVATGLSGSIGRNGGFGQVYVRDQAQWNLTSSLQVGSSGNGTLEVNTGGVVNNVDGFIAIDSGITGTATIRANSQWNNSRHLNIGGSQNSSGGTGVLNIESGSLVTVGGTTRIWTNGTVNLNGGEFDFGRIDFADFDKINANSGTLEGTVVHYGFNDISNLSSLNQTSIDLSRVKLENVGTIHGSGTIHRTVENQASGEIFVVEGSLFRMMANGNDNEGEINNFGGMIRADRNLVNRAGGFIGGRGQFVTNTGLDNHGVMAFSSGSADILGDVQNLTGGQIVTTGGATTTFFDDLVHNGSEIRTSADSKTVFLGAQSGGGSFTGTGTVYYEGDLRPGNSPDVIEYEGDVVLGTGAFSFFEIGGVDWGEYDRMNIAGNLTIDGQLSVELIDAFQLSENQEFVIAEVDGWLSGEYQGFSEGALIGNFDGIDLFITYTGGDGNDVALFTAVPEPGSLSLFCCLLLAGCSLGRRKRT